MNLASLETAPDAGLSVGPGVNLLPSELPAEPAYRTESGARTISRSERAFDLVAVLVLLPLLLPLGLIVSLVVFIDSPGSVLYRARRIGLGGRPFSMLKFRTMRTGAEGPALTRHNDARFTPVGRFLARTRLDEMPQLWQVLRGEMRLVGPRPEDPEFVRAFAAEYEQILAAPPGITGTTQLVHFADGDSLDPDDPLAHYAEHIMPAKLELDAEYVRNRSFRRDLSIIWNTVVLPMRLAAAAVARATVRNHPYTVACLALVFLLVFSFAAAGGSAR